MGALFSRKHKTTTEVLEDLEYEISELERYSRGTSIQQRHLIGYFLITSVVAYIGTAAYTYYTWTEKDVVHTVLIVACFCLFPVLVWSLRFVISWFYAVKLENNREKRIELEKQKQKILDNVKNTETYKVAMEILDRFDPERKRLAEFGANHGRAYSLDSPNRSFASRTPAKNTGNLNDSIFMDGKGQRTPMIFSSKPLPRFTPIQPSISMPLQISTSATPAARSEVPPDPSDPGSTTPKATSSDASGAAKRSPTNAATLSPSSVTAHETGATPRPQPVFQPATPPLFVPPRALPRPVPPPERSVLDKIVDYLTVDGPNNRFALICAQCSGHNGMAVQEEFEYLAFRCCYCFAFNPARKQKLRAPSLRDISAGSLSERAVVDANLVRHSSADPIMSGEGRRSSVGEESGGQRDLSRASSTDSQLSGKEVAQVLLLESKAASPPASSNQKSEPLHVVERKKEETEGSTTDDTSGSRESIK